MPKFSYTPEQQSAIDTRGCNLLVSAAAGSGKTAVLVERIIRLITNPQNLVDIDRILVVTFTDAAATEMRLRISDAIYERLNTDDISENPSLYEHLRKQAILLNKAQISTIHSFCLNVMRTNFFAIGIDPFFKIADKAESDLLKLQALDNILNREYAKPDTDGSFFKLYSAFSEKGDAIELRSIILEFYGFLSSTYWRDEWIEKHKNEFLLSGEASFDNTVWVAIIKNEAKTVLESARAACLELIDTARTEAFGYDEALENDLEQIEAMLSVINSEKSTFSDIGNAINGYNSATIRAAKGIKITQAHEQVRAIRNKSIKEAIKKLASDFFSKNTAQMAEDIENAYTIISELCRVTKEFSYEYAELKKDRNCLDFNDLELNCIKCLLDENATSDNIILSQTAEKLRERFTEVMVDEYQDINELQELILQCASNGNLFMVGDLKQSIYRFRQAKPELFSNKYKRFSYKDGSANQKVDLSGNFRSSSLIINGVNFLFRQLMTEQYGGTGYGEKEELTNGTSGTNGTSVAPSPTGVESARPQTGDSIEVLLIDPSDSEELNIEPPKEQDEAESEANGFEEDYSDLKGADIEAMAVANRIHEMVNGENPLQIFDKKIDGCRNIKYSDIAILVRSVKSVSVYFDEAFKKLGIPLYVGAGGGYLDSFEVKVAISFLQMIDNPLQDIAVMAALYSPVHSVTADEMVQISLLEADGFYGKAKKYISETENSSVELYSKLEKFISDLEKWQELALNTPISRLLDIVLTETGYLNYVGVMLKGKERQMNLLALKEYAAKYEKTSYKGIFNFVKYIEKLKKSKADDTDISALSENDDVVRLLTIHKSKGLEFPVVFVSRTGTRFNRKDERIPLLFDNDLGFGIRYISLKDGVKYRIDTVSHAALKCKVRSEDISEQVRNLYVAATRAKEKLIFTGVVNGIESGFEKWNRYAEYKGEKLPQYFMAQSDNFLNWIMTALCRHSQVQSGTEYVSESGETKEITLDGGDGGAKFCISCLEKGRILAESDTIAGKNRSTNTGLINAANEADSELLAYINEKFSWTYPFASDCDIKAKVSVSEAKRIYQDLNYDQNAEPMYIHRQSVVFPDFITGEKDITGGELGTAIHTVMEHLNLEKHKDLDSIKALINELKEKLVLSEKSAKAVPVDKIYNFVHSELADRIRASGNVKREISFIMNVPPEEIYGAEHKESELSVIVQGVIDCYFEENGGIVIVDYKSDKGSAEDIAARYKKQMELYKEGIERGTGKKVKECLFYLFGADEAVKVVL